MKTVLFAWELGAGFGHIASISRYATRLRTHGVRLVAAVRVPDRARLLVDLGVDVIQAPMWPGTPTPPKHLAATSSATMGDGLASAGLCDVNAIDILLVRWADIFQRFKPDLVVADYAPAASLIARGRVPLLLTGNGFTAPPSDMTRFPLLHRAHPPIWDEMRLLTIVNKAGRRHAIAPLERLPQLFSADAAVVETFPLLDPYDLQRTSRVDGPAFDNAPIPARDDADAIFVYLAAGRAIRNDIVRALIPFGKKIIMYAPDLSFIQRNRLKLAGARVHDNQLNLPDVLSRTRLAIHYGGSGLASHALAAGVPQVILSLHIEQEMTGLALERSGTGKLVRIHDRNAVISSGAISNVLNDSKMTSRAAHVGYTHRSMLRDMDSLAAFERKCLPLVQHSPGG